MLGRVLFITLLATSLQVVKAGGEEGGIAGGIVFIVVICCCAICLYRRCCQRPRVVTEIHAAPAAQAIQQIQIVSPPAQFMPTHPQQPMMAPAPSHLGGAQGYAPMPTMGATAPIDPYGVPPPSYTEK